MSQDTISSDSSSRRPSRRRSGNHRRRRQSRSADRHRSTRSSSRSAQPSVWSRLVDRVVGLFKKPEKGKASSRSARGSESRNAIRDRERARRREATSGPGGTESVAREIPAFNPDSITSERLYVGNLSYEATESDLFDLFSSHASVKNVEVVRDHSGRSKGFAFVDLNSIDMAKVAAERLNGSEFMGRILTVSGAKN